MWRSLLVIKPSQVQCITTQSLHGAIQTAFQLLHGFAQIILQSFNGKPDYCYPQVGGVQNNSCHCQVTS